MGTAKKRVTPKKVLVVEDAIPEPEMQKYPRHFSTLNAAYKAGQAAKLHADFGSDLVAYEYHDNRGSNLHAQAAFKKKFLQGYNSVGISTTTTTKRSRTLLS